MNAGVRPSLCVIRASSLWHIQDVLIDVAEQVMLPPEVEPTRIGSAILVMLCPEHRT